MNSKKVPVTDRPAFLQRLHQCMGKFQSVNAFAKACGIPQSTFHNYLCDGEPSRNNLILIARTAQVSLAWLVAGIGSETGAIEIPAALSQEQEADFQERFDRVVTNCGGMEKLAGLTQIPLDRLAQVKAGGQLTRRELVQLSEQAPVPLDWLISGRDLPASASATPPSPDLKLIAEAKVDMSQPAPRQVKGQGESWTVSSPDEAADRINVMNAILRRLPAGSVHSFNVEDDAMKEDFQKGDLVLIDGTLPLTVRAVYLFENRGTHRRFLARADFTDAGILCGYTNQFYNQTSRFTYSTDTHLCLGRAVQKVVAI